MKIKLHFKGLIFLFTANNAESVITYIASLKSGNAVLLLDEKLNNEIRNGLIENYKPDYIISSSKVIPEIYINSFNYDSLNFFKRIEETISNIYPEISVLLSTSGTTGSPKLVKLSYKNIQSNAESIADYLMIDENERPIANLPINYSYGLSIINSHLLKGSTIVLTDKTVFFREFWNLFNDYKCTSFVGVPYTYTMLKRINFDKIELPTLKYFTQAGGKLSEEFIKHFNEYALQKKVKFFVMYGQTEATARITYVPPEILSSKIGSIGISIPGGELRIMNDGVEVTNPNVVKVEIPGYSQILKVDVADEYKEYLLWKGSYRNSDDPHKAEDSDYLFMASENRKELLEIVEQRKLKKALTSVDQRTLDKYVDENDPILQMEEYQEQEEFYDLDFDDTFGRYDIRTDTVLGHQNHTFISIVNRFTIMKEVLDWKRSELRFYNPGEVYIFDRMLNRRIPW